MRTAEVKRTFFNKKTWEKSFEELFTQFGQEISNKIISNEHSNTALCNNILQFKNNNFDLVYLDPPYVHPTIMSYSLNYYELYHFLEGIVDYANWHRQIDCTKKNKPLKKSVTNWTKRNSEQNFEKLIQYFSDSTIVLSYRDPGFPSIAQLTELLLQYKNHVKIHKKLLSYPLNRSKKYGNELCEVLLIAQ